MARSGKPGPGRPAFVPTDRQRELVQILRANGIAATVIARNIGIDHATLRKHFKDEMAEGFDQVKAAMGVALIRSAMNGSVNAMKYWLATHGGPEWRVTESRLVGGLADAPPIALDVNSKVVVYLPDNGRDALAADDGTTDDG